MIRSKTDLKFVAVTGVDGSGKTTLTDWLKEYFRSRKQIPLLVWSRFNNYFSLPFLVATKISGHNIYRTNEGVRMGFHNFEGIPLIFRYLFVWLQVIDVNIATFFKIVIPSRGDQVTICERGPWDTLVDVAADTGLAQLAGPFFFRLFCWQVAGNANVVLVEREAGLIEASRPELIYDVKLRERQQLYRKLAVINGWKILDNNGNLEDAKNALLDWMSQ